MAYPKQAWSLFNYINIFQHIYIYIYSKKKTTGYKLVLVYIIKRENKEKSIENVFANFSFIKNFSVAK